MAQKSFGIISVAPTATRFVTKKVFEKPFREQKSRPRTRFLKTFLVTKRVAMGATEIIPSYFCAIFQADAEYEVKIDVASYFWPVFGHFLVKILVKILFFFGGCGNKRETPI